MASQGIIIELTKDTDDGLHKKGAQYEVTSTSVADKIFPSHKVVSYADHTPYESPKAAAQSSAKGEGT